MIQMRPFALLAFGLMLALAGTTSAQVTQDELKARFRERHAQLVQLKEAGTIGETTAGFLEIRPGGDAAKALVASENDDRRQLYALLAQEQKTSADDIGRQSAIFKFKVAGPNEYFKGTDGVWRKKVELRAAPGS